VRIEKAGTRGKALASGRFPNITCRNDMKIKQKHKGEGRKKKKKILIFAFAGKKKTTTKLMWEEIRSGPAERKRSCKPTFAGTLNGK